MAVLQCIVFEAQTCLTQQLRSESEITLGSGKIFMLGCIRECHHPFLLP
jgi:hypothetical protein